MHSHAAVDEVFADGIKDFKALDDGAFSEQFHADFAAGQFFNVVLHPLKGLEVQR